MHLSWKRRAFNGVLALILLFSLFSALGTGSSAAAESAPDEPTAAEEPSPDKLAAAAGTGAFDLRILHTNDTHAHLDTVAKRIAAIKQSKNESTLLLDAGDVFSGTLYFNQYEGLADLWFMNLAGYDAMTLGNHEFDKGPGALAKFMKDAHFPIVSSNIDFAKDAELGPLYKDEVGKPASAAAIYPAIVKDVNGQPVGIFGLTTTDTVALSSPGKDIAFKDYAASAQATVAKLQGEGINKIVVLSHLGYSEDQKLAKAVAGIDVIVGGHSHTQLDAPVVVDRGNGEPTIIVQTGEYGNNLGQLDVTFNDVGVATAWDGKLLPVSKYQDDAEAAAKLAEFAVPLEELKKTVIGKTDVALEGNRAVIRKQETNLGDLVADGMLAKVKSLVKLDDAKAYVAIQNAGGIRASLDKGDITLGGLLTVMPFGNNLTALKMTGQEIIDALENGVSGVDTGEGRFPQVSGLRFYYDSMKQPEIVDTVTGEVKQAGQRIVKVQIKNANGTYSNIDKKAYYIVATNSFMAGGGDFYRSMAAAKADGRFYELNLVDYEVFREHLQQVGTVMIQTQGRSTNLLGKPLPSGGSGGSSSGGDSSGQTPTGETPPGSGNANGGTTNDGGSSTPGTPADGNNGSNGSNGNTGGGATPSVQFRDTANHWASAAIAQAVSSGIANGYADGTFRPNEAATRAEFIAMLSRAFGLAGSSADLPFADEIPAWARPYIASAVSQGIASGYSDRTFRPSGKLTRAEMTVMVVRALGLKTDSTAAVSFSDGDRIPAWARPAIAAAYAAGIVGGTGSNAFEPGKEATRAEVVSLLLAAIRTKG
ncbi:hypothetical protein J19TS2_45190 [Cohnella xylanilytica]|uniref:S-layer homology domain-containing protein n=1 Tax=Cohnella xylanilytica TaxID=557555 RepID=UPI001B03B36F|nr:5'-nucleotidase C-terminal domain-containing protein [Cohnella xylanilytica]GIO14964.1 hypothetical protein J19TS2_45190 [Cohnella xylanilytica]